MFTPTLSLQKLVYYRRFKQLAAYKPFNQLHSTQLWERKFTVHYASMNDQDWLNSTVQQAPTGVKGWRVIYQDNDGKQLFGYAAKPSSSSDLMIPGVLVAHTAIGPHEPFIYDKVHQLAQEGYLALAVDLFGKQECVFDQAKTNAMEELSSVEGRVRARANSALSYIKTIPGVDKNKILAIGYCLGGCTVLELARSCPAGLLGVVLNHGVLKGDRNWNKAKNSVAPCKILAYHGSKDPYIPKDMFDDFMDEMESNHVDCEVVLLPGQLHSFTRPDKVGQEPRKAGQQYHEYYASRAWEGALAFFARLCKS